MVDGKLQGRWALEQIVGWLKREYPDNEAMQVSHETIYKTLYIQTRGALKKVLQQYLRKTRAIRRSRHHTRKGPDHAKIGDAVPISERDRPRLRTGPYQVNGKVTFCAARRKARSSRW